MNVGDKTRRVCVCLSAEPRQEDVVSDKDVSRRRETRVSVCEAAVKLDVHMHLLVTRLLENG